MPKFIVSVRHYVEEVAEIEIEAPTTAAAIARAYDHDDIDWRDGFDSKDFEVTGVELQP